jgi:two-component system response regulator AlgR
MKVLIVDDEAPARARLRHLVEDSGDHVVVGEAANGEHALAMTDELTPDIVLLDIRMPGLNGIETARHLNSLPKAPAVVFTTAYDEYAIEAFEAQAVGYVLKPVRRRRLEKALQQATRLNSGILGELGANTGMPGKREHICARKHGKLTLIPVGDIEYFIADQKYVRIHHDGTDDLIDESLKSLEEEFPTEFVRIHRSALVAVAQIDTLVKEADGQFRIVLRNAPADADNSLAISRRHLANVRRRLAEG